MDILIWLCTSRKVWRRKKLGCKHTHAQIHTHIRPVGGVYNTLAEFVEAVYVPTGQKMNYVCIWCWSFNSESLRSTEKHFMLYSHNQLYIHIYTQKHNGAMKTSGHTSLEKYTTHLLKGFERYYCVRGELETEQNCNTLTTTLMAITAFISCSPGLLNRGPRGPALWDMVLIPAFSLQLTRTSFRRGYMIIWRPLFFLRASQFRTQFNPLTVKVISWYTSTGCTCYLSRCISYFDSLAGSEVNIQHLLPLFSGPFSLGMVVTSIQLDLFKNYLY